MATMTAKAKNAVSTKTLQVSDCINKVIALNGAKLVNDTGKPEFQPFSPVILPSGNHTATYTGDVLCKENKNGDLMYFAFFMVEQYGKVVYAATLDTVNNYLTGAKYTLTCTDPQNGYSRIRSVEKA